MSEWAKKRLDGLLALWEDPWVRDYMRSKVDFDYMVKKLETWRLERRTGEKERRAK